MRAGCREGVALTPCPSPKGRGEIPGNLRACVGLEQGKGSIGQAVNANRPASPNRYWVCVRQPRKQRNKTFHAAATTSPCQTKCSSVAASGRHVGSQNRLNGHISRLPAYGDIARSFCGFRPIPGARGSIGPTATRPGRWPTPERPSPSGRGASGRPFFPGPRAAR